jgi:hypothetical protein
MYGVRVRNLERLVADGYGVRLTERRLPTMPLQEQAYQLASKVLANIVGESSGCRYVGSFAEWRRNETILWFVWERAA